MSIVSTYKVHETKIHAKTFWMDLVMPLHTLMELRRRRGRGRGREGRGRWGGTRGGRGGGI